MKLSSGFVRNFVGTSWELESLEGGLSYKIGRSSSVFIEYRLLRDVERLYGTFGNGLRVRSWKASAEFNGIPDSDAQKFIADVKQKAGEVIAQYVRAQSQELLNARATFKTLCEGDFYLNQSKVAELARELPEDIEFFTHPFFNPQLIDKGLIEFAERYSAFVNPTSEYTASRNERFVQRKRNEYQSLFGSLEKYPLTDEQETAVVTEEDNVLLNAAAGSGKSSVITAKIVYLLKEKHHKSDEIAVFAFNRDTQSELAEKIKRLCDKAGVNGDAVTVKTFHSFSLDVISAATHRQPSISKLAESSSALHQFFHSLIKQLCTTDPQFLEDFLMFNSVYKKPSPDDDAIKSHHDYESYLMDLNGSRSRDPETGEWRVTLKTMDGNEVKSLEELRIANWLFINGIKYEYERPYEVDTVTENKRQYRPDFYYPEANLYHEHFALNREGIAPKFMKGYLEAVSWKRSLHAEQETNLIETHSADFHTGIVFDRLTEQLAQFGIRPQPRSADMVDQIISEVFNPDRDISFLITFLTHYKSSAMSSQELRKKAIDSLDKTRALALCKIVLPIFQGYELALKQEGAHDYQDLLNLAAAHIESRRFKSPFKYVLVDEFQDSSQSFLRLIKALKNQREETRFFAVGDDWQSIYGFAGADIEVMRNFSGMFGYTKELFLTKTFRSSQEIVDVASRFIQVNKQQVRKNVVATHRANKNSVFIKTYNPPNPQKEIGDILQALEVRAAKEDKNVSVFILVRYSRFGRDLRALLTRYPHLEVEVKTIHTSKGLEADYVFIAGVDSGLSGFPSEISDDPLLGLVLIEKEPFPHAEERRLMYVALTRARKAAFLLVDSQKPSAFANELAKDSLVTLADRSLKPRFIENDRCPNCGSGRLCARKGVNGAFLGCSGYPGCKFTTSLCCEKCEVGVVIEKKSGAGNVFYACNQFPKCDFIHSRLSKPQRSERKKSSARKKQ